MDQEKKVMGLLADAWNAFNDIADDHSKIVPPDDEADFRKAIHDAQRIVATVSARQTSPELFK